MDVCRKYGIGDATFYNWKAKYHDMELSDPKQLRLLEEENKRLKYIVADQGFDIQVLKYVISKKYLNPGCEGRWFLIYKRTSGMRKQRPVPSWE